MSEKFPLCLECDREITQPDEAIECPICAFAPICETCLKLHCVDLHKDEDIVIPPKRLYRPSNEDARRVRIMAACNISYENMGEILHCTKADVKKHYKFQMESGAEEVQYNLANKLYEMAMAGNVTALTFFLAKKSGWKETAEGAGSPGDVNKIVQGMSSVDKTQRILHMLGVKKGKNEG